jgi:tRNA uridine 5-carboxymethylaminomethyl modification enzyme
LIDDQSWNDFQAKQNRQQRMTQLLEKTKLTPALLDQLTLTPPCDPERSEAKPNAVEGRCVSPEHSETIPTVDLSAAVGQPLAQLLKRPEITIEQLIPILRTLAPEFFSDALANDQRPLLARPEQAKRAEGTNDGISSALRNQLKSVETEIKYAGYLQQQSRAIDRLKKAEQRPIPDWFDYKSVSGLSREMQEKLTKVRPRTIAHASRIPGVTHAAVSLVNVFIEIQGKRREQVAAV